MPGNGGQLRVQAIVVNFNAGEALLRCIRSVFVQDEAVALTLVDNDSTDGSADRAASLFGQDSRFTLVRNPHNLGFACAVNQGVNLGIGQGVGQSATGAPEGVGRDYLLILNPDCEMQPGALGLLRRALDEDRQAALAGPLVTDSLGHPQRATLRRFPDPWSALVTFSGLWRLGSRWPVFRGVEWPGRLPLEVTAVEAVSGACMLVRSSAFLHAGGMDEAYGLHGEDLDLMLRLHQEGSHCLYVPQARVVHLQGLSSRSRPLWVHWQKHCGMQRFFLKFQAARYGMPWRWLVGLLVLAGLWLRFTVLLPVVLLKR